MVDKTNKNYWNSKERVNAQRGDKAREKCDCPYAGN